MRTAVEGLGIRTGVSGSAEQLAPACGEGGVAGGLEAL